MHANRISKTVTLSRSQEEVASLLGDTRELRSRHPLKGAGMPDNIASMAVALASEDASWVTGVSLPVDGGYVAQ
jgi:NAD(P)-dependent dehydrogenase (short-subunit alcohol dehydrogenase family)